PGGNLSGQPGGKFTEFFQLTKFDVKLPRLNFSHLHKWDTSIRTNMAWLSHSLEWNIRTD
ncbi:hypothetical protein, partial [Paramuribaculum intestinale]|uniref:hypothetical protein n=1 Tax=Paramuribaculum intestinale TaxID=2094151 RepID=UPI002603E539